MKEIKILQRTLLKKGLSYLNSYKFIIFACKKMVLDDFAAEI